MDKKPPLSGHSNHHQNVQLFELYRKLSKELEQKDLKIQELEEERTEMQRIYEDVEEKKEDTIQKLSSKLIIAERRKRQFQDENERLVWCKRRVEALEEPWEVGKADATTWKTSHITCKICAHVYTEAPERTPRMLGCGHTVCEGCAEKLSEYLETDGRRVVKCPYDRRATVLSNGSVRSLPKNFAISDDIENYVKTPWLYLWMHFFLKLILECIAEFLIGSAKGKYDDGFKV